MIRCLHPLSRTLATALLAVGVGALAACGSSPAPGADSANPSASSAAGSTASSAASPGPSNSPAAASASSSAPAGPAGCLASALQAQLGASQGTAGTLYQVIDLTNTSAATCTLQGYPGVSFVTGVGGAQVGKPATRDKTVPEALVTLAPGAEANMLLAVHDAGAIAHCKVTSVDWLRVFPPGDFGSLNVQYNSQACAGGAKSIMTVTAVRGGQGSASY
jgi:hypothetical protein